VNKNRNTRINRFNPAQRIFHLLLIGTFLTQGATGLARMFIEAPWGKNLAWVFGGYEACRTVHIYIGIFMICGFGCHICYLLIRLNWKELPRSLFGPDSLIPGPKDIKDFILHIAWFVGLSKGPKFDRWGYWEKFDYWAVFWGIPVLGLTGLLLAYPLFASRIIPGWGLNLAFWIHRIEAILAMGHVFIIHFFIAHLRPHNFPMDRTMFEGSTDFRAVIHEKPLWIARLEQTGTLENALAPEANLPIRVAFYLIGYSALAAGIYLLIGSLISVPYVTW
jgi:cytochrome b subunit of formate dehydrogenase